MEKITFDATLTRIGSYYTTKYNWRGETKYVYTFETADNKIYVWDTTKCLDAGKDSTCTVTGFVKGEGDYKGQHQIKLSRCKIEIINRTETYEEYQERIAQERAIAHQAKVDAQKASIKETDEIMTVPYKAYKEHYADCETVLDSFYTTNYGSFIDIIIPEGRLVPSGTRGKTYKYFHFKNENDETICLKAIKLENAERRLPAGEWKFEYQTW